MIKRFAVNLLIIFITFMGVIYGYTQSFSLSCNDRLYSYASSDITRDELVESFKDYCKSRNLFTNSSVLGASSEWLGTTLTNICNTLGIDMDYLQAQINKDTSGNLGMRWLITSSGMGLYNRIFAELLQRESLSVGDEDVDKTVYSGEYFTDIDGNKCLVYYINADSGTYTGENAIGRLTKMGTPYKYTSKDIYDYYVSVYGSGHTSTSDYVELSYRVTSSVQHTIKYYFWSTSSYYWLADYKPSSNSYVPTAFYRMRIFAKTNNSIGNLTGYGNPAIIRFNNILAFGTVSFDYVNPTRFSYRYIDTLQNVETEPTDVTVTTPPDKKILPDPPENPTTIFPGGGTDDNPDQPGGDPDPTPSGPNLPDWQPPSGTGTIGSDGTFDFDLPFSLPNLNIDWSLKDIGHKFPFCIPGDIVSFYQTLAVEPRAPSIDAHIPLGSFYDWHFVADFSQYNTWAVIIRAVEYVGFVIGLIYFTVRLVKG